VSFGGPVYRLAERLQEVTGGALEVALADPAFDPSARHDLRRASISRIAALIHFAVAEDENLLRAHRSTSLAWLLGDKQVATTAPLGREDEYALHPLLAHHSAKFAAFICGFAAHLKQDRHQLIDAGLLDPDVGLVSGLKLDVGDVHEGGRSVLIGEFSSGQRLVYKPRPLDAEILLDRLAQELQRGDESSLVARRKVLSRYDHGWEEYVRHEELPSADDVHRYFRGFGHLVIVTAALGLVDAHCENLVATARGPCLVDAECVLHPDVAPWPRPLPRGAELVLRTGLLPVGPLFGAEFDASALAATAGEPFPVGTPSVRCIDNFQRITWTRPVLTGAKNQVRLNGKLLDGRRFASDIVAGAKAAHLAVKAGAGREELARTRSLPRRIIHRPSIFYKTLIEHSLSPAYFWDEERREQLIKGVLEQQSLEDSGTERVELNAISQGIIPTFRLHDLPGTSARDKAANTGAAFFDQISSTDFFTIEEALMGAINSSLSQSPSIEAKTA